MDSTAANETSYLLGDADAGGGSQNQPQSSRRWLTSAAFIAALALLLIIVGDGVDIWKHGHDKGAVPAVSCKLEEGFEAVVTDCVDMLYSNGADPAIDRPDHLRAASSMQWISDKRLAILQDDANVIALVDIAINEEDISLSIASAYSVALPAASGGIRQFQHSRQNKNLKLDLEASVYVPKEDSPLEQGFLLGFGSGSAANRNVIIMVLDSVLHAQQDVQAQFQVVNHTFWSNYCGESLPKIPEAPIIAFHAPSLYETWRQQTDFAGSELNIEGLLSFIPLKILKKGNLQKFVFSERKRRGRCRTRYSRQKLHRGSLGRRCT